MTYHKIYVILTVLIKLTVLTEVSPIDKSMRKERTKKEFIAASKEIIESQGIDQLSVRKVGDLSGYSYATIYNYFKDLNTLLTHVSLDYLNDSYTYTMQGGEDIKNPLKRLIHYTKRYMTYMMDHPSIFKLIFISDLDQPYAVMQEDLVPKVAIKLHETLQECNTRKFLLSFDVIFQLIASSIHSKILFYITKRSNETKEMIFNQIEKEIKEVTNQ